MRKVVWTGYWTSRHREAEVEVQFGVDEVIKMTGAREGYRGCPESLYRSAEPFFQGKPPSRRGLRMSSCKMADYRRVLSCVAANHIRRTFVDHIPLCACEDRIKLNPVK
jgi:hypothetical protein